MLQLIELKHLGRAMRHCPMAFSIATAKHRIRRFVPGDGFTFGIEIQHSTYARRDVGEVADCCCPVTSLRVGRRLFRIAANTRKEIIVVIAELWLAAGLGDEFVALAVQLPALDVTNEQHAACPVKCHTILRNLPVNRATRSAVRK